MTAGVLPRLDVEFKTLDGLTLRALLLPASKRGPAMIMSPGFNMPKDASLPDIGVWFQERDITCLLYDPRGIGASDGQSRNDVDARQQTEDLHDAVTWLLKHPLVDETKIALWGLCFGGNVNLAAAAFDKRVSASILMPALERLGVPVENRISVQTYHRSLSWNILNLVQYFSPTPAMMVTPEFDMSCPTSEQLECFKMMKEPKELDILKGKGHIDWIFGDIENVLSRQLDFLQRRLNF